MAKIAQMNEMLRTAASAHGVDYDELLTEEGQAKLWATEGGLAVAKEYLSKGMPKRPRSITFLEKLSTICILSINEAAKNNSTLTFGPKGKEMRMGVRGYLTAIYYMYGVEDGLKGDELLDYVHYNLLKQYETFNQLVLAHKADVSLAN